MAEQFAEPVEKVTIRERVEWTVANSTNSSFRVLDALGGMLRGKVEISKSTIAVLDGYDSHKWIVAFSNGTKEEFATRELLAARFKAVDISDPLPDADFVDWQIDITGEESGVLSLTIHKELHEGTVDPEQPWNKQVVKVFTKVSTGGLVTVNQMPDGSESPATLTGGSLANYIPFWGHSAMVEWSANDWVRIMYKALQIGNQPAEKKKLADEIRKLLAENP